ALLGPARGRPDRPGTPPAPAQGFWQPGSGVFPDTHLVSPGPEYATRAALAPPWSGTTSRGRTRRRRPGVAPGLRDAGGLSHGPAQRDARRVPAAHDGGNADLSPQYRQRSLARRGALGRAHGHRCAAL